MEKNGEQYGGGVLGVLVVSTNDSSQQSDDDEYNSHPQLDLQLVEKCLQGDTHAFRLLYRCHQQRVRSILFQLSGADSATLDDLVQDVFLRAWKGLAKFRQTAKFSTWLYRIACNVACDYKCKSAKTRTKLQNFCIQSATMQDEPSLLDLHYQDLVQRGIKTLSFSQRTVLVLHDLQEISQTEIADILKIPVGTVKSRLFHARRGLRSFFQQQGIEV